MDTTKAKSIRTAAEAWDMCSSALPNIRSLLRILCTLPVTTMEAERLFSKVERTVTAARSTMSESRMEHLLLLQSNRDALPDIKDVINLFSKKSRRMKL